MVREAQHDDALRLMNAQVAISGRSNGTGVNQAGVRHHEGGGAGGKVWAGAALGLRKEPLEEIPQLLADIQVAEALTFHWNWLQKRPQDPKL